MSNPDVSTKNYNFDNLNLLNNNSLDLSKQQINKSGRETTVISFLRFDSFSYATSKDYARSTQRSRHNSNTTSNPRKSFVAQGIGTAVAVAALAFAQAVPFVNLLVDGLAASGIIGGAIDLATLVPELLGYVTIDNSLRINYARCATHD
ncbi:MAG: hypothetical protein LKF43_03400 [Streptococcaceae bacterium]|jgi:hypothetical protein|nr:hypothetical protein [Streptococcaceae bacterium]